VASYIILVIYDFLSCHCQIQSVEAILKVNSGITSFAIV